MTNTAMDPKVYHYNVARARVWRAMIFITGLALLVAPFAAFFGTGDGVAGAVLSILALVLIPAGVRLYDRLVAPSFQGGIALALYEDHMVVAVPGGMLVVPRDSLEIDLNVPFMTNPIDWGRDPMAVVEIPTDADHRVRDRFGFKNRPAIFGHMLDGFDEKSLRHDLHDWVFRA